MQKTPIFLFAGDILAIAVVTVIGFATHGEAGIALVPRMLTTFVPLIIGWFLVAPFLGLFNPEIVSKPRQLWRPVLAMILAGPLAALLRALWLNTVVIPIFGLVLSGSAGLGMLAWRAISSRLPPDRLKN
jgi:Mg2+/Co2+ transporter CorB